MVVVHTYDFLEDIFVRKPSLVIVEPLFDENGDIKNVKLIEKLESAGSKVCLITDNLEDEQILELLDLPIYGFLFKSMITKDIITAIERVLKGVYYIPPRIGKLLLDAYQTS